jgi:glycosyltransferase involved in cell wall biosynthesis
LISAVIPFRNEEKNLIGVLESVKKSLSSSGEDYEIIAVDDGSTDRTPEILKNFGEIRVIRIDKKSESAVGKNFALWLGAKASRGEILLFLDADVRLEEGSIKKVLPILNSYDLVSISPKQINDSPLSASLQPFVFKFLSSIYEPRKISDPKSKVVAANGQFIMIKREVYFKVCGHKAVISMVLEDVELARNVKYSGFKVFLGNGKDYGIKCRMYDNFKDMLDGWSKNLYFLSFGKIYLPLTFGLMHLFEALAFLFLILYFAGVRDFGLASGVFLLSNLYTFYTFRNHQEFYTIFHLLVGSILFIFVSLRSWYWVKFKGGVYWRGRFIKVRP